MIGAGLISGHVLLADWFFLIAAIVFTVYAFLINNVHSFPNGRAVAIQSLAFALIALGLLVL